MFASNTYTRGVHQVSSVGGDRRVFFGGGGK